MPATRKVALALAISLIASSTPAWGADSDPVPLSSGDANAFSLQLAGSTALAGAIGFGIVEAIRLQHNLQAGHQDDVYVGARPLFGWAGVGALGGAASGVGLAMAVDKSPSWGAAAAASAVGLAVGTAGVLWLNQLGAPNLWTDLRTQPTPPNDTIYTVLGLVLPVITSLLTSVTYQGIRMLTVPQPSATPTPLQTPWPSPTPPVRLFL